MAVQATGRIKVSVVLTADDRFVFRGNVIEEVWFTVTTTNVKSSNVWFKGVDFYTAGKVRGRMRAADLPGQVQVEMRLAVERLRALTP